VREIANLNAYLHDFTSALWVCGSLLLWWLGRELRGLNQDSQASAALRRIVLRLKRVTVPSLVLALLFGVVRAMLFERYEYGAPLTRDIVILLVLKHIVFAGVVAWGLWIHATVRGPGRERSP